MISSESQSPETINDLAVYVLRTLVSEKVVSVRTMKDLKQLLGIADSKLLNELIQVSNCLARFKDEVHLIELCAWFYR